MTRIGSLLKSPLRRLQMARVGLGFTVHSPFAYRFIRRVLREGAPYYCFDSEVTGREARCLFRVVAYFNPASVAYVGSETREARRIVALACPRSVEVANPSEADFVFIAPDAGFPAAFKVAYARGRHPRPAGAMTFQGPRALIAVRRHGLPPQSFKLRF